MKLLPSSNYTGSFTEHTQVSREFRKYVIPVADSTFVAGEFGGILHQQVSNDLFSAWYHVFQIDQGIQLLITAEQLSFPLNFTMGQAAGLNAGTAQRLNLAEGQFQLIRLPAGTNTMTLEPGTYRFFTMNIPVQTLLEFTQGFPFLSMAFELYHEEAPTFVGQASYPMPLQSQLLLERITGNRQGYPEGRVSIESDAKKLLLVSLAEMASQKPRPILQKQVRTHEEVIAFIRNNLDQKLTIDFICAKCKISRNKLYADFAQLSQTSIHEFITNERIEKAKLLLVEEGLPVNEVAARVGYPEASNFIRVFKRKTGLKPTQYLQGNHGTI